MRQIAYSNSSDAPPSSVQLNWAFNDGNTGAQGTGGALTATGSVTVNITAVNDAPVLTAYSPTLPRTEDGSAYVAPLSALLGTSVTDADGNVPRELHHRPVAGWRNLRIQSRRNELDGH